VVSRAVHEQVRHLLAYEAEDLGPLALKNMERPVHGFRVGPACAAGVRATAPVRSAPPVATSPAALVAVGAPGAWASVSGFASALASVGRAVWRASRAAPERGHSGP
jgi:hypothetical protein